MDSFKQQNRRSVLVALSEPSVDDGFVGFLDAQASIQSNYQEGSVAACGFSGLCAAFGRFVGARKLLTHPGQHIPLGV